MGKFSVNAEQLEKIRESRANYLTPGSDCTPPLPDTWRKDMEAAEGKVGPWKWWERVTITKADHVVAEDADGNEYDRIDIGFECDESSESNAGRMHVEFLRLYPVDADGDIPRGTKRSFGVIDQIVKAVGTEWVLDDDGDHCPLRTPTENLINTELMVKFATATRFDKKNKEWRQETSILEFAEVE